jgi:hypothetical protein
LALAASLKSDLCKPLERARRNGALEPFHLIFTFLINIYGKYISRDISRAYLLPIPPPHNFANPAPFFAEGMERLNRQLNDAFALRAGRSASKRMPLLRDWSG